MIFKRFAVTLALAFAAAAAAAAAQAPAPDFAPERFRAHVAFLADDLLEGRETGTRGYGIAARYVATQYEALGLRPGARGGGWYQHVPFVRSGMTAPARINVGTASFAQGEGVTFRQSPTPGRTELAATPAVFAGYGLEAPSLGIDDYRGLDVRGRVVVVLDDSPAGLPSDVAAHLENEKRRIAGRRGAVGLVTLRSPAALARIRPRAGTPALPEPGIFWVGPDGEAFSDAPSLRFNATADAALAEALFAGAPRSLARVRAEAARTGARPRGFALRQSVSFERESAGSALASENVLGILPGTDPSLAGEYVLLMAHLDGLGVRESGEGDRIRNGAMDNATGVATLIEVARQMSRPGNRPRRSVIFAAVTAEEKGLLGAQYLARNPAVDGRIVGVVNLDMPVLTYDFTDVIAFGAEHSTMGPIVARAAAGMNVALTPDPLPEQGLFTRSDHYMFVREGIPSVFLMTGFRGEGERQFRDFLANTYHTPRDDMSLPFDWQAAARFAELNYRIAREIADSPQPPLWYRGSFFGDTFAPNATRATRPETGSGG